MLDVVIDSNSVRVYEFLPRVLTIKLPLAPAVFIDTTEAFLVGIRDLVLSLSIDSSDLASIDFSAARGLILEHFQDMLGTIDIGSTLVVDLPQLALIIVICALFPVMSRLIHSFQIAMDRVDHFEP